MIFELKTFGMSSDISNCYVINCTVKVYKLCMPMDITGTACLKYAVLHLWKQKIAE